MADIPIPSFPAPGNRSPTIRILAEGDLATGTPTDTMIGQPNDLLCVLFMSSGSPTFTIKKPGDSKLGRGQDVLSNSLVANNYVLIGPTGSDGFVKSKSGVELDAPDHVDLKFFGLRF